MTVNIDEIIGGNAMTITWWQMACRGVFVFVFGLILVRLGGRRVFGRYTSFDIVLGVILGSTLSRAITGNAKLFPTLFTAALLVSLHWLIVELSSRSKQLATLFRGTRILLVKDGRIRFQALDRAASHGRRSSQGAEIERWNLRRRQR